MKKLLTFLLFVVAIASFGGIVHPVPVHADEALTPAQAAVLQQSLDAMKAELLELQSRAAAQAGTSASLTLNVAGLSAGDAASLRDTLSLLASALTSLQSSLAQNPQLTAGREAAVLATLRSVGVTLAMIGTSMASSPASPSSASAPIVESAPSAQVPPLLSATGRSAVEAPAQTTPSGEGSLTSLASAAPETAQVGSAWSWRGLNWPLVIVIMLVVVAVALWLFWPGGEDEEKTKKGVSSASTPVPVRPAAAVQPMITPIISSAPKVIPQPPQSPQFQTPPQSQPQQQQRRPA